MSSGLRFAVVPGSYAVARLGPTDPVPDWGMLGTWWSVTRTRAELSVVCAQVHVPTGVRAERGFALLQLAGPFPFTATGVLAAVVGPLAAAGIPVFTLSTFDTDYLLVAEAECARALFVLQAAGHVLETSSGGCSAS